jgi:Na+/proline symporter
MTPDPPPGWHRETSGQWRYAPPSPQSALQGSRTNTFAVCSLVLAVFGVFVPVAVVMGFVARRQIRNSAGQEKGSGIALAGIITSFAWLLFLAVAGALALANRHQYSRPQSVPERSIR